jgi:hypothetical protein
VVAAFVVVVAVVDAAGAAVAFGADEPHNVCSTSATQHNTLRADFNLTATPRESPRHACRHVPCTCPPHRSHSRMTTRRLHIKAMCQHDCATERQQTREKLVDARQAHNRGRVPNVTAWPAWHLVAHDAHAPRFVPAVMPHVLQ